MPVGLGEASALAKTPIARGCQCAPEVFGKSEGLRGNTKRPSREALYASRHPRRATRASSHAWAPVVAGAAIPDGPWLYQRLIREW
eukprot:5883491-Pleurochrysis_carterae.AAC.2